MSKSVEFVCLRKGRAAGVGWGGVASQGHYNSLCSHHSCGVFMSDGLFAGLGFWGSVQGGSCSTSGAAQILHEVSLTRLILS